MKSAAAKYACRQQSEANRQSGHRATPAENFDAEMGKIQKQSDNQMLDADIQASSQTSEVRARSAKNSQLQWLRLVL